MILSEAASLEQTPSLVPTDLKRTLKLFQSVLAIVMEHYHAQNANDKRGQLQSIEQFKSLKRKMTQYRTVSFIKPIVDQLDQINNEFISKHQSTRTLKKVDSSAPIDAALRAWQSRNPQAILQAAPGVIEFMNTHRTAKTDPLANKHNPFYRESPLFFISNEFLELFEIDQIKEAASKDLSQFKFSYLPFPLDKQDNFQYIAYYILNLRDNQNPVNLSGKEIQKYLDMAYSGSKYQELVELVQGYLLQNNFDDIPKIVEMIKEFPEIEKLNNSAKQSITTVYRGIAGESSLEFILQQEKANRFVATSDHKSVAENFALQRGHLEAKDTRRSEEAVVLTYSVTPESILLDTTIFGGVFGEGEILIDVSKAVFEDAEFL